MNLVEALESRAMLATVNVGDFGARADDGVDDRAAVQAAISASAPGDVIQWNAGRYDFGATIDLRTNRTYQGAGRLATLLKFNVGSNGWGARVEGNAQGVTVENFRFDGAGLTLDRGNLYRDIIVRRNSFTNPAQGTFNSNGPCIFQAVNSDGLRIDNNRFENPQKYGLILFGVDRLRIVNNVFKDVYQGAHILNLGTDNTIANNRLTGLVRMGFELQRHGTRTAVNTLVENNTITAWREPTIKDSFGLSIVPDGSENTRVRGNFIQAPGSGPHRAGYGIEFGARTGSVTDNTIGGIFANHIVISGGGGLHNTVIPVTGNRMYGVPLWGQFIATESFGGPGFGVLDKGNVKDPVYANMPMPQLVAGDANNDGVVGLHDLDILRGNFGGAGVFSDGDFNGDGRVNLADFNVLAREFNDWPRAHGPVDMRVSA